MMATNTSGNVNHNESNCIADDGCSLMSNYESEFEQSEANDCCISDNSVNMHQYNISDAKQTSEQGLSNDYNQSNVLRSCENRRRSQYHTPKSSGPNRRLQHIKRCPNQMTVIERWENAQIALADARSQNYLLRKQLQECQTELRTVQRQFKLQSIRLNRVIGQEADFPQIIDRLTAELRSWQTRVREKTAQCDEYHKKMQEMQRRLAKFERDAGERRGDDQVMSKPTTANMADQLAQQLERERQRSLKLQQQLDLANKAHKHRITTANEQIKKLRTTCHELQEALNERTKTLQEKIKLLELQNIYSKRIPKRVIPVHVPSPESTPGVQVKSPLLKLEKTERKVQTKRLGTHQKYTGSTVLNARKPTATDESNMVDVLEQMAYEVAEGKFVESIVDPTTSSDEKTTSTKELIEMNESDAKNDPNPAHVDDNLGDSCTSCDIPHVNSEEADTFANPDEIIMAQTPTANHDLQNEVCVPTAQVPELNRSLNNREIYQEENGMIQNGGKGNTLFQTTNSQSTESIEAIRRERERKDRLLKELSSLDYSVADMNHTAPKTLSSKNQQTSNKSEVDTTIPPDIKDLSSFEKSREKELWDELFGSGTKTNSHEPTIHHHSTMDQPPSKTRQKVPTNLKLGEYIPTSPKVSNCKLPSSENYRRNQSMLPSLNESKTSNGVHPKYSKAHFFRDDDDEDESDSELEELQA